MTADQAVIRSLEKRVQKLEGRICELEDEVELLEVERDELEDKLVYRTAARNEALEEIAAWVEAQIVGPITDRRWTGPPVTTLPEQVRSMKADAK